MTSYFMLIAASLMLAADFALNKIYQRRAGTSLKAGLCFNALLGLFTALIFFAINGFRFHFSWYSMLMAGLMATLVTSYNLIGFRILRSGSMALYTLFLMTGGMTIPYLWGLLFLEEPFTVIRTLGLLLIIGSVALSNSPGGKTDFRLLMMCAAIFCINGFTSVVSKLHQIEQVHTCVSSTEFVMLSGICKCVLSGGLFLFVPEKKQLEDVTLNNNPQPPKKLPVLLIILASAIISGVSYLLQLTGAKELPATVLYPFITGSSMVFSTLTGIFIFREKPSKRLILSVIICFAATFMFL